MAFEFRTVKELYKGLKNKEFSSLELTKDVLKRIEKHEKKIDSLITFTPELALKQAEQADKLIATESDICWLSGVPYALKDVIVTKDIKTTAASRILEDFKPPFSATVYENLQKVKSVLIGKTNCDEFAMGASTENSAFKKTKNPWDLTRVPGGSSGGSAAIVAAGLVPFALGTDTGGSIRQPASFCGVVGLKPSYGRVSRYGLIAMGNSLDQAGPFTRTVEDAAYVLNVIAAFDPKDSTSVKAKLPDYFEALKKSIKGSKFGVPQEYLGAGVDKQIQKVFQENLKTIEKIGGEIVEISLPHSEQAISVYYLIMASEVSTNLSRYDGVRFGGSRTHFGPEPKRRIMLGTYSLSSGYFDAYYLKAAKVRRLIYDDFQKALTKVDFIVGPTSPVLPFKIGEKISDPLQMYLVDVFTVPQSLAGLPAISIPAGFVENLPIGLQLTANHFQEEKLLGAAFQFEKELNIKDQVPEVFE